MSFIIAVAGKGGTGKTTISALIIGHLARQKKGKILAIDADPNSNLAEALGLKVKEDIGSIVDSIAKNPQIIPVGMTKDTFIDYRIQTNIIEAEGFDLLSMGRPEGPGCYCYVNNLLRAMLKRIADDYDYVVIDNEAGFEHLSRRTMRKADVLLLVSDSTQAGSRAVKRIADLVKELAIEVKKVFLVLNRFNPLSNKAAEGLAIDIAGIIPEDKGLLELSREGRPLRHLSRDSSALSAIEKMTEEIVAGKNINTNCHEFQQ